jgi:hypothetical protein
VRKVGTGTLELVDQCVQPLDVASLGFGDRVSLITA